MLLEEQGDAVAVVAEAENLLRTRPSRVLR
jgi:hypothetical protein